MGEYNAKNGTVKIPITEYDRICNSLREFQKKYEEKKYKYESEITKRWRDYADHKNIIGVGGVGEMINFVGIKMDQNDAKDIALKEIIKKHNELCEKINKSWILKWLIRIQ